MNSEKTNHAKDWRSLTSAHELRWQQELPPGAHLEISWENADTYSGVFRSIRVKSEKAPDDWEQSLRTQAEALVQHISFLSEKLAFLELDHTRRVALLRSTQPFRKDKAVDYFEIQLIKGQEVLLLRIRNENRARQSIPFVLPWELADRLIHEMTAVLLEK